MIDTSEKNKKSEKRRENRAKEEGNFSATFLTGKRDDNFGNQGRRKTKEPSKVNSYPNTYEVIDFSFV